MTSNILLCAPQKIDPLNIASNDKVFRREYAEHVLRLGTKEGNFFIDCKVSQKLFDVLLKEFDYALLKDRLSIAPIGVSNENSSQGSDEYSIINPLVIPESERKPIFWNSNDLFSFLGAYSHVRYTGAGLSIASGLPSMIDLKSSLSIDLTKEIDECLIHAIKNPSALEQAWMRFVDQMNSAQPSKAHRAIAKLCEKYGVNVITENMDILHQKTGVEPLMIDGKSFSNHVLPNHIKQISAVVAVGLSHDDRGFLAYFKKHNPQGIIISLNLAISDYMSKDDVFIQGDVQKILNI